MIGAYIIYSEKLGRFYIGSSTDINQRIINHNNHHHGNKTFTSKADDWVLFLSSETNEYPQAKRVEMAIKKKSRGTTPLLTTNQKPFLSIHDISEG